MSDWKTALDIGSRLLPDLVSWINARLVAGAPAEDVEVLARRMLTKVESNRGAVDELIASKFPQD